MLRSILILLLGIAIGAAAYALISGMGEVDPGPSYETAITVAQGKALVRASRELPEYATLKNESGEQLQSLLLSKAALLTMMAHAKDGFAGIRFYPIFKSSKQRPNNNFSLVVVPFAKESNGNFKDILVDNIMFDYLNPCPSACPITGQALTD
jgi:ABC-type antimicrobial peptide transport system permease subunit